jgi:probable phosphoglycerate mutase
MPAHSENGDGAGDFPPVPFFFLRHGETDWNREGRLQGRIDVPLNERGLAQAHEAGAKLAKHEFAAIVASPLSRARRTAEIVAQYAGRDIVVDEALVECGWGEREGTYEEGLLDEWHAGHTPPGAESFADFCTRAANAVRGALRHPGPVLVVAHGGIFTGLRTALGLPRDATLANAIPLRLDPKPWRIKPL